MSWGGLALEFGDEYLSHHRLVIGAASYGFGAQRSALVLRRPKVPRVSSMRGREVSSTVKTERQLVYSQLNGVLAQHLSSTKP